MKNRMLWLLLLLTGCMHKTTEQQYADHINDPENKIVQRITIGEVTATAKWLPDDYRQLMNKTTYDGNSNSADGDYYYFNVKFDKKTGDKPNKDKTLYLDFDMQKDFVLLVERDSVLPAICQKIENGIGGSYEYMLAFEKGKKNKGTESFDLIYHDKIFGTGTIAFVYNEADIKRIPVLKKGDIQ